ncbi:ComEC/Rec2 family competence protein [Microbacterium oleivorans]|uniref:ComEC/Rec2 family competence protein n=1 Tax=Microbacterium oleivorans TaxID=273677 RepID=A0A7D5EV38_9MICO|nr:ComEC/Rec2 family competence protein [Microbacterium oleivorans]QLD10464.1 ComEC/Rec2 family competence protein [Microbacterium oleivorans]
MSARASHRDLRLLPVVAAAWLVSAAAVSQPQAAPVFAGTLWVLCGGATTALVLRRMRRGHPPAGSATVASLTALAAFACAIAAASATHVALLLPDRERVAALPISGGRVVEVTATVVGKPERSETGWRFDAEATSVTAGGDPVHAGVPIVVRAQERPRGLDLGAAVSISGSAFVAEPGNRAVLIVDVDVPEVRARPPGIFAAASRLRADLLAQAATLPQPGAGLIAGLAVGDTTAVTDELDAQMKTASLSHLTAVSGANCAVVVGLVFTLAGALGIRRGWRVVLAAAGLVGFIVLVSPEPSVVRAGAMAAISMLAVLLGRAGAGAAVLCLAVSICLVFDPWLATSLGFALSAAATGALVLAAGPIGDSLARIMPRPLALAVAVPVAAQLACTPLIVAIDPRLPLFAVVANILTAPAAPLATIAGLAACLTAGLPVLAAGLVAIAWLPCAWIAATAQAVDAMPVAALPWMPDVGGALLAALLSAAAIVVLLPEVPRALLRLAASVLAIAVGIAGGTAVVTGPIARADVPVDWSLAMCDVGQGDAFLLRSRGQVALMDTGPDPALLDACLDLFGVERIDLLVLTHFDLDHVGGADAVAGRAELVLHGPTAEPSDNTLLAELRAEGADVRPVAAGATGTLGGATWEVLWPRARRTAFPPGNDASVVLAARGGGIPSVLMLGDLSEEPQAVIAGALHERFEVVKVAHHGSADQSPALYRRVAARVALVGVGENDYGHPRAEIVELLTSSGAEVVRADVAGAAALTLGEDGLELWHQRSAPPSPAASSPPPSVRVDGEAHDRRDRPRRRT